MISKTKAIAALEELKGDSTGVIAATIEDCQKVIGEMVEENGWISVEEKRPKPAQYLCVVLRPILGGAYVRELHVLGSDYNNKWNCEGLIVTHWMPLPEPPKEPAYGK